MKCSELEEKLRILRRNLDKSIKERDNAQKSIDEISDAVVKIQNKIDEIEKNLNGTVTTVEKRVQNLRVGNKFKNKLLENTNKIVFNSQSAQSIQTLTKSIGKAKAKFEYFDNRIDELDIEISSIEEEISELKVKINEVGE